MAAIITTQLDWDGNKCYEFWKVAPCCGGPDPVAAVKCCVWWCCCPCFPQCQLWGTALGFPVCAALNHCCIPCCVGQLFWLLSICLPPSVTWLPACLFCLVTAPTLRYNIRQKKGIRAAGPCNGWCGDCLCAFFGNWCCCFAFCQELRAVEVNEWDCLTWMDTPPKLIESPVNIGSVWYHGGSLPCSKGAGGGGVAQPGYKGGQRSGASGVWSPPWQSPPGRGTQQPPPWAQWSPRDGGGGGARRGAPPGPPRHPHPSAAPAAYPFPQRPPPPSRRPPPGPPPPASTMTPKSGGHPGAFAVHRPPQQHRPYPTVHKAASGGVSHMAVFSVGEAVSAQYINGEWYDAHVTGRETDGSYSVKWYDGSVSDGIPAEQLRLLGSRV